MAKVSTLRAAPAAALAAIALMLLVLPGTGTVRAETGTPAKPCTSPSHRQFDFWVGTWNVTQAGKTAGQNKIESILNGCALMESWKGTGGVTGHSINIYDSTRDIWHQTWVDSTGSLLTLEGRFKDGAMVLEGMAADEKGAKARQRITWTAASANEVRQLWQSSTDGGKTWKTEFDGLYRRQQ
jgi:hypothetical protein